jgi:hypothetical protein
MTNFPTGFDDIKDEPTEEQQARRDHDQELKDEGYIESQALDNQ